MSPWLVVLVVVLSALHRPAPAALGARGARVSRLLASAESSPTSGVQPWGRWAQTASTMTLELNLVDSIKTRDVCCELVEGWLIVKLDTSVEANYEEGVWGGEEVLDDNNGGQPPLLFGRFAQPVIGGDLVWLVEEDAQSGRRVLSVEVPKAARIGAAATADCIFDETLLVNGESCLAPGLSQGYITMNLPRPC